MAHTVSYEDVLRVARAAQGRELRTLTGRAGFRTEVVGDKLYVIPSSTGKRRFVGAGSRKAIERFNEVGSYSAADYQDVTFNSVYILRLISLVKNGE
jgi:hypothetical protein